MGETSGVRDKILQAGTRLLHDDGFGAITQPRIARAAGVSQSHLTYYFPTRADLLLALAEYSVNEALARAIRRPEDPLGTVLEGVRYLPRVRMLLGLVGAADRDPALRPALNRLIAHVRGVLAAILREQGLRGDPEEVQAFHGAIVGLAALNLGRQDADSTREIEAGLQCLLDALRARSEKGQR